MDSRARPSRATPYPVSDKGWHILATMRLEAITPDNYAAALDEVLRLKPSSSKGRYLRKVTLSTTMGPGIPVDANRARKLDDVES